MAKPATLIASLATLLNYIPEGHGIHLDKDVFLCGEDLDGSDKIYGFKKVDGQLLVESRQSSYGYPLEEMESDDLYYIFEFSPIASNLARKGYSIQVLSVNQSLN